MDGSRLKCSNAHCDRLIQPATAKRNNGLCGPCHGQVVKAARDEYVRQNRRTVDPFAGVSDTVELIRIAHQNRPYDPLINYLPCPRSIADLYSSLTETQAEELMEIAGRAFRRGDEDFADEVARHLAAFTAYPLDSILKDWLAADGFWPAIAFRFAGPEIERGVLNALKRSDINANHALQAAAWIGSPSVINAFKAFDSFHPPWATRLHILPSDYARTAGWELMDGQRRELSFEPCLGITPLNSPTHSFGLSLFQDRGEQCPWCSKNLVNILAADEELPEFKLPWKSFEIVTCAQCTCFGAIFSTIDSKGHGKLAKENVKPSLIPEKWGPNPWAGVAVELVRRRPTHAASLFLSATYTQIGGLPGWIQDMDYPRCPGCRKTMKFLAQIDNGQFRGHEGIYYVLVCTDCGMAATSYQQT